VTKFRIYKSTLGWWICESPFTGATHYCADYPDALHIMNTHCCFMYAAGARS
jgi:hypothetical protein